MWSAPLTKSSCQNSGQKSIWLQLCYERLHILALFCIKLKIIPPILETTEGLKIWWELASLGVGHFVIKGYLMEQVFVSKSAKTWWGGGHLPLLPFQF